MKVAKADNSASATAPIPMARAIQPGAAAATVTISAVVAWPTLVMSWNRRMVWACRNGAPGSSERK